MKAATALAAVLAGTRGDSPAALILDDGAEVTLRVRCLDAIEASSVRELARAYAKGKGVEEPADGDPVYDLAVMAHTCAVACLDDESPTTAREPFFAGVEQARHLRPEQLVHLFEQQRRCQDEADPKIRRLAPEQFAGALLQLGDEDEVSAARFFSRLGPALQWSSTRSLALQLRASLTPKSSPSSASEPSTPA